MCFQRPLVQVAAAARMHHAVRQLAESVTSAPVWRRADHAIRASFYSAVHGGPPPRSRLPPEAPPEENEGTHHNVDNGAHDDDGGGQLRGDMTARKNVTEWGEEEGRLIGAHMERALAIEQKLHLPERGPAPEALVSGAASMGAFTEMLRVSKQESNQS
eukprot:1195070-Prorocentrum_minimum.AAC.1